MRFRIIYLLAALLLISTSAETQSAAKTASAKPEIKNVPAGYADPSSGKQMFNAYCASCHGQDAKGNGPAAPALKVPATDLTTLAAKHGGAFPDSHVAEAIKGDWMVAAHGSKEMPVWGPVFLYLGERDPGLMQLRVRNLTKYIASLQQK